MREIARRPEKDRRDLFMATAQKMQVHQAIIEKDFWVCWVLDYLFQDSPWKDKMIFKGGTSLSKAYGAIQRFSEDVDLILDWSLLGHSEAEAFQDRSGKKQTEFCDGVRQQTVRFLRTEFTPSFRDDLRDLLGENAVITQEEQSVIIEYPRSFTNQSFRNEIVLEIGPKALQVPNEQKDIRSYAAERYPEYFTIPSTAVRTVNAERTFWEKATILHQEAHRTIDKKLPPRYSRHYYDLYQLSQTPVLDRALAQIDLLQDVARFKIKFFRSAWARFEVAKPGTLKLLPLAHNIDDLRKDYYSMQTMLFGIIPSFDEIMKGLATLEAEINGRGNHNL